MSHVNECKLAYYQAHGATSNDIDDAEMEYLLAEGAPSGQINDMWQHVLGGPVCDKLPEFWKAHGCKEGGGAPFPSMSHLVIDPALTYVEDGVPGTAVITYKGFVIIPPDMNLNAFIVKIDGVKANITGVDEDLGAGGQGIIVEFQPDVTSGQTVTFQYDPRVDPRFTEDGNGNKPINFALSTIDNRVAADEPFSLSDLNDYLVGESWNSVVFNDGVEDGIKVDVSGTEIFYSETLLLTCDLSTITLPPLHNDFCDGMKLQGFCIGGNCP